MYKSTVVYYNGKIILRTRDSELSTLSCKDKMMSGNVKISIVDEATIPLTLTAYTAGSTVTLGKNGSPTWNGYYSKNGGSWTTYTPGTTGAITLSNVGDYVQFKGTSTTSTLSTSNYLQFAMTGSIIATGNVMSMCSGDSYASVTTAPAYSFYVLFANCTALKTAPIFPATKVNTFSYCYTFNGCTNLKEAPILPANLTGDEYRCYRGMFMNCTSLTTAPSLPSTTIASSCYSGMFYGCTSLTTAPRLYAESLPSECYAMMFQGCSSLVISQDSGSLEKYIFYCCEADSCSGMFTSCSSSGYTGTPSEASEYYYV